MAQILTDIYEGYVMYSQMREYKSIRNFRFKKLKRYKIAKMKHQLHTLKDSGNYKPNLVVRVLTHIWETQKYLWGSVFYDSFKKVFKVGSSTNQLELKAYTRSDKIVFEEVSKQLKKSEYDVESDISAVLLTQDIKKLEKVVAEYEAKKVEEPRKITHVKYIGETWKYAVKGKWYKVTEHNVYPNGNEYFKFKGEFDFILCEKYKEGGVLNEYCKRKYEIIYDNEIGTSNKVMEEAYKHHRNQIQRLYQHGMKAHLERQQQNTIDILRSIKNFK